MIVSLNTLCVTHDCVYARTFIILFREPWLSGKLVTRWPGSQEVGGSIPAVLPNL